MHYIFCARIDRGKKALLTDGW